MHNLKRIYLVRHGQSESNVLPVYQDPMSQLSELGKKQAPQLAKRVSKISHELIVSSTLPRALETATAIATYANADIVPSDHYIEIKKPSVINGKEWSDEQAKTIHEKWIEALFDAHPRVMDSENYVDVVARVDQSLKFLEERDEQSIIVVSHDFFLRAIIARVTLGDTLTGKVFRNFYNRIKIENTGISTIDFCLDKDLRYWKLSIFNDHAHLG
jgi:broad specificity phosphatase PhoE